MGWRLQHSYANLNLKKAAAVIFVPIKNGVKMVLMCTKYCRCALMFILRSTEVIVMVCFIVDVMAISLKAYQVDF